MANWEVIPPTPPEMKREDEESSDGSETLSQYLARNFLDCSYETNLIADSYVAMSFDILRAPRKRDTYREDLCHVQSIPNPERSQSPTFHINPLHRSPQIRHRPETIL